MLWLNHFASKFELIRVLWWLSGLALFYVLAILLPCDLALFGSCHLVVVCSRAIKYPYV